MKRFIGRKKELESLERTFMTPGFTMTVIYGRRRVGKSTLIREFVKDKRAVYFTATKAGIERNLELLGREVMKTAAPGMPALRFADIDELFRFIGQSCMHEKTVLVIDELPFLAEADKSVLSIMQKYIDTQWIESQMYLIVCGSSISFMEDEVLREKSPLFGRRTSQIRLDVFSYPEAALFVPNFTDEEKAVCYGVTGGVAKYLSLFDDSKSLDENISALFFDKSGYLYEEPGNLLAQEFRNVAIYADVISAIAAGANKVHEIASKTHIDPAAALHVLSNLSETGIVEKVRALTDEKNKKKVQYVLKDNMFRFWYRFVPEGMGAIELGFGNNYYLNDVKPQINDYMANVFEEMCRYYTLYMGVTGGLGCFVTSVGKWWGTNPSKKEQTDIDVVGLDTSSGKAVLGECKYRNEPVGRGVYEELIERNGLISNEYVTAQYLLFSKAGFTDWLLTHADENMTTLISLKDMYSLEI